MHFTLRQIEAFIAVADTGSFTRAADHLHLTPSAVSQLIIEIEGVLGYKLFDRSTRKVVLSPAGRAFMPAAQALSKHVDLARTMALDIRNQAAGVVRVAAPMVVASVMLPRIIASYKTLRPKVTVRLIDSPVEALVDKVASRQVDLAVGPDRPIGPEVERVLLYPSPWVVWCAPKHLFARMPTVTWADLGKAELVAAGRDHEIHLSGMMRNVPDNARVVPVQVVDNVSTALALAATEIYYTISPAYVQPLAVQLGLVMRQIENPVLLREMSLFRPADRSLSPAATGFAAHIEAALKDKPAAPQEAKTRTRSVR
ncbi:DNA-binding transcriptional regulator, LysR family [Variovorax sp. HW608]|uniref:LysR family transcriptional regulator n=1 Tax=Variovorax sp. HW608 TaxID=1034889 RepID=UPI0008200C6E|nr:LysR family transcriptional regulator [Variovorax sp. HW608]SCK14009.1 DNA-binding transcriptional regulator, LysR family [Variovorax sp. HW608]